MNPLFKKFVEDYPDMTLIGLGWAIFWRLYICFFAVGVLAAIFLAILEN